MEPRAYSIFEIKSIDEEQRIVEGWASTPALDRGGDIMEPSGAKFALPQPLFYMHRHDEPIGDVFHAQPSSKGIYIKARIEKGTQLPYIEKAWSQIKHRLMRGFSIDWRPLKSPEIKGGARLFSSWEWVGTSVVSIPMNQEATITAIKSIDAADLAALGTRSHVSLPGVSGLPKVAAAMTTPISQQVTAVQTELADKSTSLEALIAKYQDEGGLTAEEQTDHDAALLSVKSLTSRLDGLKTLEASQAARAGMVIAKPTFTQVQNYGQQPPTQTRVEMPALPKGTLFTRYAMAVAAGRGSYSDTLAYAKRWEGQTPEVVQYVKAMNAKAIAGTASTASSPNWGSELVYPTNLASEFIELLRAATVIGRIPGFRNVPFNVRIPRQIGGSTVNWVGEQDVKPVSELEFDTVILTWHKIAGIVVLTEELVRLSSPSAEETVRTDLIQQIARFMDRQFLDPSITATADRPASITNGVASPAASGSTAEDFYFDMNIALSTFDVAEVSTESIVIVTTPAIARGLATLRNALGQFEFPGMSMMGGTVMGFPVIVSSSVPAGTVILIAAGEIFMAKDAEVRLDASREATLDMSGGGSPTFSLWQRNCIGIRAEQFADWVKRRDESVAIIDTAAYGPTAPAS